MPQGMKLTPEEELALQLYQSQKPTQANSPNNGTGNYNVDFVKALGDVGKFGIGNIGGFEKNYRDSNPAVDYKTPPRSPVMPIVYEGYNKPSEGGTAPKLSDAEVQNIAGMTEAEAAPAPETPIPANPEEAKLVKTQPIAPYQIPDYGDFRKTIDTLRRGEMPESYIQNKLQQEQREATWEDISEKYKLNLTDPKTWTTITQRGDTSKPPPSGDTFQLLFKSPEFNAEPILMQQKVAAQLDPVIGRYSPAEYFEFRANSPYPLPESMRPEPPSKVDYAMDFARPIIDGAIMASKLGGSTWQGMTARTMLSFIMDNAIQSQLHDEPTSVAAELAGFEPHSFKARVFNTLQMLGLNKVGDKAFDKLGIGKFMLDAAETAFAVPAVIKNWKNPSTGNKVLDDLGATYSMYKQKTFGDRPISRVIEDLWATTRKANMQDEAARRTYQKGIGWAEKASGIKNPTTADLALSLQRRLDSGLAQVNATADKEAETWIAHAQLNPAPSYGFEPPQLAKVDPKSTLTATTSQGVKTLYPRTVYGPIHADNSAAAANEYLMAQQKLYPDMVAPADELTRIALANQIMRITTAQVDEVVGSPTFGQVISTQPFNSEEVWGVLKGLGDGGYGDLVTKSTATKSQKLFQQLYATFRDDADRSIANPLNFKNGSQSASDSFRKAVGTLDLKYSTFGTEAENNALWQLVENKNTPTPQVETILKDKKLLERVIKVNQFTTPTGTKIKSKDMLGDLQGYVIKQIMEAAKIPDPGNRNVFKLDPEKLAIPFQQLETSGIGAVLFPNKAAKTKMMDFLNGAAFTQQKPYSQSIIPALWMARNSIPVISGTLLAAGGAGYHFAGSYGVGAGAIGVGLGGIALSKAFTNEQLAKSLYNLSQGMPLGISQDAFNKLFVGALQGFTIYLVHEDGSQIPGTFDGKEFVPMDKYLKDQHK